MKKNTIFKTAFIAGLATIITIGTASIAFASGWAKEGGTWRYTDTSGNYVYDTWKQSGNDWYYLDGSGRMATNQLIDDGSTYYVNSQGAMVRNSWINVDGDWYFLQDTGKAKEDGFLTIDNIKYHFSDGVMDTGWIDDGNASYFMGNNGAVSVGWKIISDEDDRDEGWYYFESNGKLVADKEKKIDGQYYVFNSLGQMLDNWVEFTLSDGSKVYKYYVPGSGYRASGWLYLDDTTASDGGLYADAGWYYFKNGIPYTANYKTTRLNSDYGVAKINGQIYCFDANGCLQYGTVTDDNGAIFYFGDEYGTGAMQTGQVTINDGSDYDEETMYFSTSGGLGNKGSSYTGVKNGYLYDNGLLIKADDDRYELVSVGSKTYVVSETGRVKESGTVKLESDDKMKISKRSDGLGYTWTVVD